MGVLRAAINQPEAVHSSNLHPSNVLVEALQAFATQEQVGLELTTLDPQQAPPPNLNILATDVGSHNQLRFTRPVMTIERFLVHHKATPATQLPSLSAAPRSNKSSALIGTRSQDPKALEVSQRHTVQPLGALIKADQPHIFSLFDQISGRTLPYTVASSHEYEIYRHFVDDLAARPIGAPHLFRWGLNKMESIALFSAADRFIEQLHKTGEINALKARFFWHDAALNNLERHIFLKRVRSRLPEYIAEFKSAGKKHDIDWRLLAAMAYQESHWDAQAVSPTGVRGLMMLTLSAAREVGITNRQLPASSIHGGAAYFKKQKARLPAFIPEPDRTWMALAAYNLGTSTVLRAIKRTQKHGENPTDWFAIQKHLSAFEQDIPTRHDIQYRKGAEQGLHYVKHIRLFYDLLQHPSVIENNITPTPINLAMARSVTP
jgi:membrane-bound lytic murein transglycosylase F